MTLPNLPRTTSATPNVRAIFFDFLGTLLDWHTPITLQVTRSLQSSCTTTPLLTSDGISLLALQWRASFFRAIAFRHASGLPPEDIDTTHRTTLSEVLKTYPAPIQALFTPSLVESLVKQWHALPTWPDVIPALKQLKASFPDLELFVLANGTTRLHLDLLRSSGLREAGLIDMPFSSQLLGCYKPDSTAYLKAMELVGVDANEAIMVAAHAYDLRAARRLVSDNKDELQESGMRTVYIRRWTEDYEVGEDFELIRRENDAFIEEGQFQSLVDVVRQFNNE